MKSLTGSGGFEEEKKVKVLVALCNPMDCIARQAPLSMGFSRQEDWSGLPFPSPGDLPDPGIEPGSPALAGGFFTTEAPGRAFPIPVSAGKLRKPRGISDTRVSKLANRYLCVSPRSDLL